MTTVRKGPLLGIFLFVFLAELAVGYYLAAVYGFMSGDASSRVANAFYVLHSREPALANIGFVWNPLPSFLEMLVLIFYPLYPALASHGLAAVLVSGLFAALTAAHLFRACVQFGLNKWLGLTFVLLYAFNPYIFYYGANGLTEVIFIYFINIAVLQMLLWMNKGQLSRPFVIAAFALALAFWTRYETVFFGAALAFAVLVWILRSSREPLKERLQELEASWTVLLTPVIFSGLLWIFFNYSIKGDAFYFLTSSYGNLGQAELLKSDAKFADLVNNPPAVFVYVLKRLGYFSIPLVVMLAIRVIERRIRQWDALVLLLLAVSIPSMQFLLLLKGGTAAWIRYYMYAFPIAVIWIPYEISRMKFRKAGAAALIAGMIASAFVMGAMMNDQSVASDEYEAFRKQDLYAEQQAGKALAAYINEYLPDQTILTDSFSGFIVILSSKQPKNFVITGNHDYEAALRNPAGHQIDYVIIPNPHAVGKFSLDSINVTYPRLYDEGADWAVLQKEFNGYWKLYKVLGGAEGL